MQKRSTQTESPAGEDTQLLTISPEKVCFVIVKAKEYDAKAAIKLGKNLIECRAPQVDQVVWLSVGINRGILEQHGSCAWSRQRARSALRRADRRRRAWRC